MNKKRTIKITAHECSIDRIDGLPVWNFTDCDGYVYVITECKIINTCEIK